MKTIDQIDGRGVRLHGLARSLGVEIERVRKDPGLLKPPEVLTYTSSLMAAVRYLEEAANALAAASFRGQADQAELERSRQ